MGGCSSWRSLEFPMACSLVDGVFPSTASGQALSVAVRQAERSIFATTLSATGDPSARSQRHGPFGMTLGEFRDQLEPLQRPTPLLIGAYELDCVDLIPSGDDVGGERDLDACYRERGLWEFRDEVVQIFCRVV